MNADLAERMDNSRPAQFAHEIAAALVSQVYPVGMPELTPDENLDLARRLLDFDRLVVQRGVTCQALKIQRRAIQGALSCGNSADEVARTAGVPIADVGLVISSMAARVRRIKFQQWQTDDCPTAIDVRDRFLSQRRARVAVGAGGTAASQEMAMSIKAVKPPEQKVQSREPELQQLDNEQEAELAKRIEAGVYAELLLLLASTSSKVTRQEIEIAIWEDYRDRKIKVYKLRGHEPTAKTIAHAGEQATVILQKITAAYDAMVSTGTLPPRESLERLSADGRNASDQLITANLPLVEYMAKKYYASGAAYLDLSQGGALGLGHAVAKFDYTKGYKFTTYAMWWVRRYIEQTVVDQRHAIRIPRRKVEKIENVSRKQADLQHDLGREPSEQELAAELDQTPEYLREVHSLRSTSFVSLDRLVGESGDTSWVDTLIPPGQVDLQSGFADEANIEEFLEAMEALLTREEFIVVTAALLSPDDETPGFDKLAEELGIVRQTASNIRRRAIAKMIHPGSPTRQMLANMGVNDPARLYRNTRKSAKK